MVRKNSSPLYSGAIESRATRGSLYGCLPLASPTKLATDLGASFGYSSTTNLPLLVSKVAYSPGPSLADAAAALAAAAAGLAAGFWALRQGEQAAASAATAANRGREVRRPPIILSRDEF